MKGQRLDYSVQNNAGVISGDDQRRYSFTGAEWRGQTVPSRGQIVDFEIDPSGQALNVYVLSHP